MGHNNGNLEIAFHFKVPTKVSYGHNYVRSDVYADHTI